MEQWDCISSVLRIGAQSPAGGRGQLGMMDQGEGGQGPFPRAGCANHQINLVSWTCQNLLRLPFQTHTAASLVARKSGHPRGAPPASHGLWPC